MDIKKITEAKAKLAIAQKALAEITTKAGKAQEQAIRATTEAKRKQDAREAELHTSDRVWLDLHERYNESFAASRDTGKVARNAAAEIAAAQDVVNRATTDLLATIGD
jgi:hypothetical protein